MKKPKQLMNTAQRQLATTSELLVTEECMLGETDFECWCKLWKASASDPDVDCDNMCREAWLRELLFPAIPSSGARTLELGICR